MSNNPNVPAKVVLVAGAASGMGYASACLFAARGWKVLATYRTPESAGDLLRLAQESPDVAAFRCDVTQDADCRAAAADAVARHGRLDVLVHCAGTSRPVPLADLDGLTAQDFHDTTAVNVVGPFQMARACAQALRASGDGAVVIVGSYGGIVGGGASIAYAASKGAVHTLTLSLAQVLAPEVRVNAIAPALTEGGYIQRVKPAAFEARRQHQIATAPLRKVGRPDDVARTIFAIVNDAPLMTGEIVRLDCGLHIASTGTGVGHGTAGAPARTK